MVFNAQKCFCSQLSMRSRILQVLGLVVSELLYRDPAELTLEGAQEKMLCLLPKSLFNLIINFKL